MLARERLRARQAYAQVPLEATSLFVAIAQGSLIDFAVKPYLRGVELALHCSRRNADDLGGLLNVQPPEVSKLYYLAFARVKLGKTPQRNVESRHTSGLFIS